MATTEHTEIPTWRLREKLRLTATEHIEGRKNFERHVGRVSDKPLTRIELDPREALQLLDALDRVDVLRSAWHRDREWVRKEEVADELDAALTGGTQ